MNALEKLKGMVEDVNAADIHSHMEGDKLVDWAFLWRKEANRLLAELEGGMEPKSGYEKGIAEIMGHCRETLVEKHREYAYDDDYRNFNAAAGITGQTPEQVLWGYALKHIVSINDMIDRQANHPCSKEDSSGLIDLDKWREKCGDLMCYMAILYAMERDYDFARRAMYRGTENSGGEK